MNGTDWWLLWVAACAIGLLVRVVCLEVAEDRRWKQEISRREAELDRERARRRGYWGRHAVTAGRAAAFPAALPAVTVLRPAAPGRHREVTRGRA